MHTPSATNQMIENRHVIVRSEKLEKNTREAIQIAEITKMQIEINNRIQLTTDLKEWKKKPQHFPYVENICSFLTLHGTYELVHLRE